MEAFQFFFLFLHNASKEVYRFLAGLGFYHQMDTKEKLSLVIQIFIILMNNFKIGKPNVF